MSAVTLSNAKVFECKTDQTVLDAAHENGLALEYSCRTGRCGVCKVKVVSGDTTVLKNEICLSNEELANNFVLTCCRSAVTDIEIDAEDLGELALIQPKISPCRIDSLQLLNNDVLEVVLRTPPSLSLNYLPGQYIDILGKNGVRRSYSIANAPRDDGNIILHIRKVENGVMSRLWFEEAQVNDLLRFEGPLGTFSLRAAKVSHLIFMATGTGIAPIKAILEQLDSNPNSIVNAAISLYWGGRKPEDIYWTPDFANLDIQFIPVLSRSDDLWKGRKGYVQQAVLEDQVNLSNAAIYACGSDTMINAAHKALAGAGLAEKSFHSDAFVSAN